MDKTQWTSLPSHSPHLGKGDWRETSDLSPEGERGRSCFKSLIVALCFCRCGYFLFILKRWSSWKAWLPDHFRVVFSLCVKTSLRVKRFMWNCFAWRFIFMQIKLIYIWKVFARRLVLKQRHKGTRKWPIDHVVFDFQTLIKELSQRLFSRSCDCLDQIHWLPWRQNTFWFCFGGMH